jgi:hypothetical protein
MAYDAERGVTYLFGGEYSAKAGDDPDYRQDVWEYDGVRWRQVFTTGGPPVARGYATIIPFKETSPSGTPVYGFRLGDGIGYVDGDLDLVRDRWAFRTTGGEGVWTRDNSANWSARGSLGTGGLLSAGSGVFDSGERYYSTDWGG